MQEIVGNGTGVLITYQINKSPWQSGLLMPSPSLTSALTFPWPDTQDPRGSD